MGTDYPTNAAVTPLNSISRNRYLELTILAKETADILNEKGLKPNEYCQFGDIVRRMLELD